MKTPSEVDTEELKEALAWFVRRGDSLKSEVSTAHSARRRSGAASSWMLEDDDDFASDLDKALKRAAKALGMEGN